MSGQKVGQRVRLVSENVEGLVPTTVEQLDLGRPGNNIEKLFWLKFTHTFFVS